MELAMGSEHPSPHVVMFAGPMVSHAVPCLLLARKLCAVGINISFINAESVISNLKATGNLGDEEEGLRVVAVPNGEGYEPSETYLVLLETAEARTLKAMEDCVKALMKGSSQGWAPPCCAIIDTFMPWAVKITEPLKLNSYMIWTNTAAAVSVVLHSPVLKAQGIIPVDYSQTDKLKPMDLPCIPALHPLDFVESLIRPGIKFDLLLETARVTREVASGLLVNSLYELESSVFDALNDYYHVGSPSSKLQSIIPVGPLLPASIFDRKEKPGSSGNEKDPILQWLDKQPNSSVLFVSYGTVAKVLPSQMMEIGLGLEASEQRFIWVVRSPAGVAPIDLDKLLPGFSKRIEGRGLVVTGWAPQVKILQHPATGGFFTHCGWSSVVESISGNVPMLTWPLMAEQRMNSRWLVEVAKAALKVRNGFEEFATKEQVEKAIRQLMCSEEGQALRKNVSALNDVLHNSVKESGSSSTSIKAFAHKLQQLNAS